MTENDPVAATTPLDCVDSDDMETWDCIIDNEDDIDWDNIIATTEDDFKAGRYAFNSADYATHEEAMEAMRALIHSIAEEAINRVRSNTSLDAQCQTGHDRCLGFIARQPWGKPDDRESDIYHGIAVAHET